MSSFCIEAIAVQLDHGQTDNVLSIIVILKLSCSRVSLSMYVQSFNRIRMF